MMFSAQSSQQVKMNTNTGLIINRQERPNPKVYEIITLLVFLFLLFIVSFIFGAVLLYDNPPPNDSAKMYALQTLNAMPTPTTIELDQVGNIIQTTPEPTITPEPTPTEKTLQKPEGQVNILLLGSDARPGGGGFRTDSITWVSLNPKDGFVSAVSFPRDLFVDIPGMASNRINVAFPRGGFDLLADTLELNFGVRPDYYILIDFNGFTSLIENLGGINVQASKNLSDTCARWINPSGYCSVGPGLVHMNGDVALWYVRSRYSTNDIDRARRAQEVVEAIFERLMRLDTILKVPELFTIYRNYVQTDLNLSDIMPLVPLASEIYENGDIRNNVLDFDYFYSWITPQGAQVLVPDKLLIRELMIEVLDLR